VSTGRIRESSDIDIHVFVDNIDYLLRGFSHKCATLKIVGQ
jgi:hypothetical protein